MNWPCLLTCKGRKLNIKRSSLNDSTEIESILKRKQNIYDDHVYHQQ